MVDENFENEFSINNYKLTVTTDRAANNIKLFN